MKIGVIGGGASGMMTASLLGENGHEVVLFEKNEKLGKKIYITGKGRCNVTNLSDSKTILNNIVNGEKFMTGSIFSFSPADTMQFFENLGVKLKVERGNRVFPESDKASDITKAFEKKLKQENVKVLLNSNVQKIVLKENSFVVVANGEKYDFDKVVVATGGITYKTTGSTGDGYKFAKEFGHNIENPVPALCEVLICDKDLSSLQGLSLKNIKVMATNNGKTIFESEVGEMLFTQNGVSGPLILSLSSFLARLDNSKTKIFIDFKPALSTEKLLERIDRDITSLKAKQISSLFEGLLPKSLAKVFAERLNFDDSQKANQLNKHSRQLLALLLKSFELKFKSLAGENQAVITSGGISTKEINPKTMESKLVKGLYFVGEVLDVDALTGGFNLQVAFSTAASCARNIDK